MGTPLPYLLGRECSVILITIGGDRRHISRTRSRPRQNPIRKRRNNSVYPSVPHV